MTEQSEDHWELKDALRRELRHDRDHEGQCGHTWNQGTQMDERRKKDYTPDVKTHKRFHNLFY